jgi:hypothetical protein
MSTRRPHRRARAPVTAAKIALAAAAGMKASAAAMLAPPVATAEVTMATAPGTAGGFHHHQILGRIGTVGRHRPQPGQILRRGAEPPSGPDKPAQLVSKADLMRGYAARHATSMRRRSSIVNPITDDVSDCPLAT